MITVDVKPLRDFARRAAENSTAADRAAQLAVNEAARFARVQGSRHIVQEVVLTKSYVDGKMAVKPARGASLEAEVTAYWRPISLARFLISEPRKGKLASVRVKRGGPVQKMRAFKTRLRAGKVLTDTKFNIGLAKRVPEGETLRSSQAAKRLREDKYGTTYLLYGPSVSQVFKDVRFRIEDPVAERMQSEFLRQFGRLNRA